jgi:hypothetical protein
MCEVCGAKALNDAYQQRDRLVYALTRVFPSLLCDATDASSGWSSVVVIQIPTGQISFHIPDDELAWFAHLPRYPEPVWDGHDNDEKWRRVMALGPFWPCEQK